MAHDVDRRTAEEALRISEQALGQSVEGQHILDEATEAFADAPATEDPRDRRITDLEEQVRLTLDLVDGYVSGRNLGAAAAKATEHDLERIRIAKLHGLIKRGGHATILIHPGSTVAESFPVPVGLNGRTIVVPRGVPTKVPVEFLEVLEQARQRHIQPLVVDGHIIAQEVSLVSYPYSVLDVRQ